METGPARNDRMRRPVLACAGLVGLSVLMAAFAPRSASVAIPERDEVADAVMLTFADAEGGQVVAYDAEAGQELARYGPGEGGFVRVAMRGFAGERKRRHIGPEAPFMLARMPGGQLVLGDGETGRVMLLDAFGPSNEGAFAALLELRRETR